MTCKKKIVLIGSARHGKDTVAAMLEKHFGYSFESSSMAAARIFIFDRLKGKYGYRIPEECFEDRVNRRSEWYDLICDYNRIDKSRLAREIMRESDCYVGMRDKEEIAACKQAGIFDLVIGVIDHRKPAESADSFNINLMEEADVVIPNSGTLADLERRVLLLKPLFV
jgi:hypothetical protein